MKWKQCGFDILRMLLLLAGAFGCSLLIQTYFQTSFFVPMILALAVILVSLLTQGYVYGIISSLSSALKSNENGCVPTCSGLYPMTFARL